MDGSASAIMIQSSAIPDRFRSLDAWRGVCALLVVLFHAPTLHVFKDAAGFANLQLCVDFFFVLSGFVISHAYRGRLRQGADGLKFMLARLRRLWPLHVVALAAFVILELMKLGYGYANPHFGLDAAPFSEGRTAGEIMTNLLFLQAFGLHSGLTWNGPSWSIAVEFWTSAIFALAVLLAPRGRNWVFLALAASSAVVLAIVSPETLFVSHSWSLFRCLLGFFTGCLVYDMRLRFPAPKLPLGTAEIVCAIAAGAFLLLTPQGPAHLAAPLVFAPLIYVFSFERGFLSKALKTPIPQALGRWSFSIYMTHMFIFQLIRTFGALAEHKFGVNAVVFHNGDKLVMVGTGWEAFFATLAIIALVVVPTGAFCCNFIEGPLSRLGAPFRKSEPSRVASSRRQLAQEPRAASA